MDDSGFEQSALDSVQTQLQALHSSMTAPEQDVLEAVLGLAAQWAGASSGEERGIIIVGGRQTDFRIPLNPAVLVGLNPQPLPPGE